MRCGVDILIIMYDSEAKKVISYKSRDSARFLNLKDKLLEEKLTNKDVRNIFLINYIYLQYDHLFDDKEKEGSGTLSKTKEKECRKRLSPSHRFFKSGSAAHFSSENDNEGSEEMKIKAEISKSLIDASNKLGSLQIEGKLPISKSFQLLPELRGKSENTKSETKEDSNKECPRIMSEISLSNPLGGKLHEKLRNKNSNLNLRINESDPIPCLGAAICDSFKNNKVIEKSLLLSSPISNNAFQQVKIIFLAVNRIKVILGPDAASK